MPSYDSVAEWRRKFKQRDEEFAQAIENHARLDAALQTLDQLAKSGNITGADLEAPLAAARAATAGLDQHLRCTGRPSLYTERCPPAARDLAQRVFDVPELLELILSKLPMLELLKTLRVNKQWHGAIESSTMLQRQLSLRSDTIDGHLRTAFQGRISGYSETLPGFGTRSVFSTHRGLSNREETVPGNEIVFKAEFSSTNDYYHMPQTIGSRMRRMFICQPPVKELQVYVECCRYNLSSGIDDHDQPSGTVKNEKGLTIGDLHDKTKQMLESHKYCQNAEVFMLDDETGEVKNDVFFRGRILLKDDDPLLIEKREKEALREKELKEKKLRRQHIEQYRTAARLARESQLPIMDLNNFIAAATERDVDSAL